MKTITKVGFLIYFLTVSLLGFAGEDPDEKDDKDNRNPTGCRDMGYQFELKTLHLYPQKEGASQSLFFLFNKNDQAVNLYQMHDDESSRSLYLNHVISARQWAVLSTNEKQVKYICTVADPKSRYGKVVDCAENLRVCEFNNVRYGVNNRGNFWLVNSNTRNAAVRDVVRYGIIPGA